MNIIKILKFTSIAAFVIMLAGTIFIDGFLSPHHKLGANPERLLKKLKVELPEVQSIESSDNFDRGASRFDCYNHTVRFVEPLPVSTIAELEELCNKDDRWETEPTAENVWYYYGDSGRGDLYMYSCNIYRDVVYLEYCVDEFEGGFKLMIIFPLLLLCVLIFSIWNAVRKD